MPTPMTRATRASVMALRPMRWWDVAPVVELERELFGATAWSAEAFWSELALPQSRWYVVVESAGEIVGYAGLLAGGPEADVQTLAVAPSAQRQGVGTLQLTALVEQAAARGASSLLLEVRADNAAAVALYERHRFERIAVRRRYYQPGDGDAWVMRRRPLVVGSDHADLDVDLGLDR